MTPELAVRKAEEGQLPPVLLLMGEETWQADRIVHAVLQAAQADPMGSFNVDKMVAGEVPVDRVLAAATTLPMMAASRTVLVRSVERWESKDTKKDGTAPLDVLATYAADPNPSTRLVLVATKLHGQRKLVSAAKKGEFLVKCDAIPRRELAGWVQRAITARGHTAAPHVADLIAELAGPDLAPIADAIERLALYVGADAPFTDEAVETMVTRVRHQTVWQLLDALGKRRLGPALHALADSFDARDGGLRLLGTVNWNVRQLVKFSAAQRRGASAQAAAQQAGIAPFKVKETQAITRSVGPATLARWVQLLGEADLALKSSKRSGPAILEKMVVDMCAR